MFCDGADVTRSSCSPAGKATDPLLGWDGGRVGVVVERGGGEGAGGLQPGDGGEAATS